MELKGIEAKVNRKIAKILFLKTIYPPFMS